MNSLFKSVAIAFFSVDSQLVTLERISIKELFEIQIIFGLNRHRNTQPVFVAKRIPDHKARLTTGFLLPGRSFNN
jgi:hypothetical protein